MTHQEIFLHRPKWDSEVPHIKWKDGTVTAVAIRQDGKSWQAYVAQQLVGIEPTKGLACFFAEAEAKRRKYAELEAVNG